MAPQNPDDFDSQIVEPDYALPPCIPFSSPRPLLQRSRPVEQDDVLEMYHPGSESNATIDEIAGARDQEQDSIASRILDTQFDSLHLENVGDQTQTLLQGSHGSVVEETQFTGLLPDPNTQVAITSTETLSPQTAKLLMPPPVIGTSSQIPVGTSPVVFRRADLDISIEGYKMPPHKKPPKGQRVHAGSNDIYQKETPFDHSFENKHTLPEISRQPVVFQAQDTVALVNGPTKDLVPVSGIIGNESYVEGIKAHIHQNPPKTPSACAGNLDGFAHELDQLSTKSIHHTGTISNNRVSSVVTPIRTVQRQVLSESRKRARQPFQTNLSKATIPHAQTAGSLRGKAKSLRNPKIPENISHATTFNDINRHTSSQHLATVIERKRPVIKYQQPPLPTVATLAPLSELHSDDSLVGNPYPPVAAHELAHELPQADRMREAAEHTHDEVSPSVLYHDSTGSRELEHRGHTSNETTDAELKDHGADPHETSRADDFTGYQFVPESAALQTPEIQEELSTVVGSVLSETIEVDENNPGTNVKRHSSTQPENDLLRPVSSNSRPHSRRSNRVQYMNRPFSEADLSLSKAPNPTMFPLNHTAKIKKPEPGRSQMELPPSSDADVASQARPCNVRSAAPTSLRTYIQLGEAFTADLEKFEAQKKLVEATQAELETLQSANEESKEKIDKLEVINQKLTKKISRFSVFCEKYKKHMNGVVDTQNSLLEESRMIKERTMAMAQEGRQISEEMHQVLATRAEGEGNLRHVLKRVQTALSVGAEKEAQNTQEIVKLRSKEHTQDNELAQRVAELGRERYNVEQLKKQLATQTSSHEELVELLKNTPTLMIEELTKDGSIFSKVLSSQDLTITKCEELSTVIDELKNHEPKVPQSFITLIEDNWNKIEKTLQATDSANATNQESNAKTIDDLKKGISLVCLDQVTKSELNGRISEFRELNVAATAGLNAREIECQRMATQISELSREVSSCHDQLTAKSEENARLLAIPKEDIVLVTKLHDLETANLVLRNKCDLTNQELDRTKAEGQLLQEASLQHQDQIGRLEQTLSNAHAEIHTNAEEKKINLESSKSAIEKARQETAKAANARNQEMIMRHDALVKNLEQRRNDAESRLKLAQEEVQKTVNKRLENTQQVDSMQAELSGHQEKLALQAAQINELELQIPSQEQRDERERFLISARTELAHLKATNETLKSDNEHYTDSAYRTHQQIVVQVGQVDRLQAEKEELQIQLLDLQSKFNALVSSNSRLMPSFSSQKMGPPSFAPQSIESSDSTMKSNSKTLSANSQNLNIFPSPGEALEGGLDWYATQDTIAQNTPATSKGGLTARRRVEATANHLAWKPQSDSVPCSQTSKEGTPRVALRRNSNIAGNVIPQVHPKVASGRTRSRNGTRSTEVRQSTVTHTTRRTEETRYRIQDGPIPFSALHPSEPQPPSSLTDVGPMIEILGSIQSQEDLDSAYKTSRELKDSTKSATARLAGYRAPTAPTTTQAIGSSDIYEVSDDDDLAGASSIHTSHRKSVPVMAKAAPMHRSGSTRLKSVLKKSTRKSPTNVAAAVQDNRYEESTGSHAVVSAVQNRPQGSGVNTNVSRPHFASKATDYNRVASGATTKPQSNIDHRAYGQRTQLQVSPIIAAPKRNNSKRKASTILFGNHDVKRFKGYKESYPNGAIIPESQETQYRR